MVNFAPMKAKNVLFLLSPLLPLGIAGYFLLEDMVVKRRAESGIVMMGDTHVKHFPIGTLPITFIGDDDETTTSLLAKLPAVAATHPRKFILEIGSNDLMQGVPVDSVLARIQRIREVLSSISPSTKLFVCSVPATQSDTVFNRKVVDLTRELRQWCKGQGVYFFDLHFLAVEGFLNPYLTDDGKHLNYDGYRLWRWRLRTPLSK